MTIAFPPDDSDDSELEQPSEQNSSWEQSNRELQEQLAQLIQEVCQAPAKSARRRKGQNQILRLIQQSGKLKRERSPHYEGCIQITWLYLFENLCEVNRERYPRVEIPFCEAPNILSRLNLRLGGCIKDAWAEEKRKRELEESPKIIDGEFIDWVDKLPAPDPVPLPSASLPPFLLDLVRAAVEADASGELRRCHLENHPEANCQALILQQLSSEVEWEAVADELRIPIVSLSPFYEQHCRPLVEKISVQQLMVYVRTTIKADELGELCGCHIEHHPEANCQTLILRRLPPEMKWKDIANEFGIPMTTLSAFYQRHCKPRLKTLCEQLLPTRELEER